MPIIDLIVEKLKNGPKPFKDIVSELVTEGKMSYDDIGYLYSDMSLDHRFVSMQNNVWDLSDRHKYSEKVVNIKLEEDEEETLNDSDEEDDEIDIYEDEEETYLQSLEKVGIYVKDEEEDLQ